jgi:hypothetical protein
VKYSTGYTSAQSGTASFDSSGNFIIKEMFADQPTAVQLESNYYLNADGTLLVKGKLYDKQGKLSYSWSCTLIRAE